MMHNYYNMSAKETAKAVFTDISHGLSDAEAVSRLKKNGYNELIQRKKKSFIQRFFEQFNDFMIITLLIAAAVSYITSLFQGKGDIAEPIIILVIVVFNALLGLIQESRAQKSLDELKKLSAPQSRVLRDGIEKLIPAREVVVGDILILKAGDIASADCRIIKANHLSTDESSLTGESDPVMKNAETLTTPLLSVGDRKNMIMSSSPIVSGNCIAIAVSTGMNTEVGQIAAMLNFEEKQQTPLQTKLSETGKILSTVTLIICALLFFAGLLKHLPAADMFMTSVSLAVAAIPEGLPAIVTIMLALGLVRMSKHNAIIRNLPSVETLGSASVICTDKTGTLTQNKMHVSKIYSEDEKFTLSLALLCSEKDSIANPTDTALQKKAEDVGISKSELCTHFPLITHIPFDSSTKRMASLHKTHSGSRTIVKGALEYVLPMCSEYMKAYKTMRMSTGIKNRILSENKRMTSDALRVIAVAYRDDTSDAIHEEKLIFAGLIGIEDPPRKEAENAVTVCKKAGIRPVMITGDHVLTALSVAKRTGIADDASKAITGAELDEMTDEELCQNVHKYNVFARVTPMHKVRIVKAFQANGHVTAMTGDGVNDAPALSCADIGCSMGKSGTDVAKSASDMVLTDDNFATIVSAVMMGRNIFANIKKAVQFLLSSNIGEILAVCAGLIFGWTSPLSATQLLWVNLVTDSLPAIALGLDPPDEGIMEKPPRDPKKSIFADGMWLSIIFEGLMIGALSLLAFSVGANVFCSLNAGRTMAFAVLSLSELVHSFNMRSERSVLNKNLFKNPYLTGAFLLGLILEVSVISIPYVACIFDAVPLTFIQWVCVGILSLMPLVIVELQKLVSGIFDKKLLG